MYKVDVSWEKQTKYTFCEAKITAAEIFYYFLKLHSFAALNIVELISE